MTDVEPTTQGWTADDSTFGARLALIRQKMAWGNVKEAAVACGLPAESWRTWERDNVVPRRIVEIASIIADKTGCDYGWLLTGPRLREGRVVYAGTGDRQTTEPYSPLARTAKPNGHFHHRAPSPATRRLARISQVRN